jgi:hypothetical protein
MNRHLTALIAVAVCTLSVQASPVTDWHTFRATTATTLSGQGTASPVFGSTAQTASQGFLIGYFDALSLTNEGDRITLNFAVSFTDAAGMVDAGDNFRLALFDLNGQLPVTTENSSTAGVDGQTDDWRGYWYGVRNGSGTGSGGSIRRRNALVTGDNPFAATGMNAGTAPSLGTVGGTPVILQSSAAPEGGPVYFAEMVLERSPSGVTLGGFFRNASGTNIFLANDDTAPLPTSYGAVGYLNGNGLNLDQMNFQNVMVYYSVSNALQITSQPTNVSVIAGQRATFAVSWTGSGLIPTIQWRENGIDILNATNSTYIIPSTTQFQDTFTYSVVIGNVFGDSVTSSEAVLTVISDTTPPIVLSASSLVSNSLNVIFSEPVDAFTAEDLGSYTLAGNTVSSATLINGTNVHVVFDAPITGSTYELAVQSVQDVANNPMVATNVTGLALGFEASLGIGVGNGLAYAYNDKAIVYASGADIFNSADEFHYVYKPVSGDFDITVRVESLLNTDANAKAGLMARVNTFFDSRNVMIEATPGRFIFQYRTNAAEASVALSSPRPPTSFPSSWVRLARSGSLITAYATTNFGFWTLIGSHDTSLGSEGAYPPDILLGLAVTSHNPAQLTRAEFSGFGQTLLPPTLTIVRNGTDVEVSWPASAIGFILESRPTMFTTWTEIPGSATTNRVVVPATGTRFFRAYID